MPELITIFAVVGVVLLIASLASGVVERAPISFPMIFLAVGFIFGERGLGIIHVDSHSSVLEAVAILSLSFVLFLDAVNLRVDELGSDWAVPMLSLGPGTLLTIVFVAIGSTIFFGTMPLNSLLMGAILASVDPVLLRDIVRDERIPKSIRRELQTESGTNDIVVLPIILILSAVALGQVGSTGDWLSLLLRLFLLGPVAGIAVGAATAWLMNRARSRWSISREYRALYGIGTILAAYVAGESVGGSGFLAVFAAGLTVALADYDLCDCFLEYGEATSEMAMLLAFLLFGAMLSTVVLTVPLFATLGFAFFTLLIARPAAIGLVLRHASISMRARVFIGWFGPRGLSSLLFGLLLVTQGVPGSEQLLAVAGVVVIVSSIAHGVSAGPVASRYARETARHTLEEEREGTAAGLFRAAAGEVPRVTPRDLADMLEGDDPPMVLDVRTRSSFQADPDQIPGSVRVPPDLVREWAEGLPRDRRIVAYCT